MIGANNEMGILMRHRALFLLSLSLLVLSFPANAGELVDLYRYIRPIEEWRRAHPDSARLSEKELSRALFKMYGKKDQTFEQFVFDITIGQKWEDLDAPPPPTYCNGYFMGDIRPEDYKKFEKMGNCPNQDYGPSVFVNSEGGDVETAGYCSPARRMLFCFSASVFW